MFSSDKNHCFKKISSGLIILVFLLTLFGSHILFPPKPAQAIMSTLPAQIIQYILDQVSWAKDYSIQKLQKQYEQLTSEIQQWTKNDTLEQRSLDESWNKSRYKMLKEMSQKIIDEAQGKDAEGNATGEPNFVLDWQGFLMDKARQAGEQFVDEDLNNIVLCDAFGQQVVRGITGDSEASFQSGENCPVENLEEFYEDFEQGGWDTWYKATEPNAFSIGAFMMASDALTERVGLAYEAEKEQLVANQGYVGNEEKGTPGSTIKNAVDRASMMDFDYLLQSDQINEYFGSVADAFISRIIDEGLEGMETGTYQNQGTPPCYTPDCLLSPEEQDLNYVKSRYDHAVSLADVLDLIKENLQTELSEQNQNLALMEEIASSTCQAAADAIKPEIAQLQDEISQTETKIDQADIASLDVADLIITMDAVLAAEDTGDQDLLTSALDDFNAANDIAVASLQELLETQSTDLTRLYSEANEYAAQIVEETTKYTERRGNPYGNSSILGDLTETLYGCLSYLNMGFCQACE